MRPAGNGDRFFSDLRGDHARFGRVLALIGRHASVLADRPDDDVVELLHDAVDYIVNFQHRYHHPREDRMFERIAQRSTAHDTALRVLRNDHEQSFKAGQELLADMRRLRTRSARRLPRKALTHSLQRFALDMREHIRREDELMYSSARAVLDRNDWNAIVRSSSNPRDPLRPERGGGTGRYRALARYVAEGEPRVVIGTGPEDPISSAVGLGTQWIDHTLGCLRLVNRQVLQASELGIATCMAAVRPRRPADWCASVVGALNNQTKAANRWIREWRAQLGLDT